MRAIHLAVLDTCALPVSRRQARHRPRCCCAPDGVVSAESESREPSGHAALDEEQPPPAPVDTYRRALGVDFGRKKTGVAVSVGGLAPRPLEVLQVEGNSPELLVALRSLAQREFVSDLVVGRSRKLSRATGEFIKTSQTEHCRLFAERLADWVARDGLRVWLVDEFGTSRDAEAHLAASGVPAAKRKGREDAVAAALILDTYFRAAREVAEGRGAATSWFAPKLVKPTARALKGAASTPAGGDGDAAPASLGWLGDSRLARPRRLAPAASPAQQPHGDAGDSSKPAGKAVPLHVLRRDAPQKTRRALWEEHGL